MDILPTKRNLLLSKQNISLAQKGHDLLDKKYIVLVREKKHIEKLANEIREEIFRLKIIFEKALIIAQMETGKTWETIPPNFTYELSETTAAFDEAFLTHKQILTEEKKLEQLEKILENLNMRINRTKKRASALRNVVIPSYETRIKFISERLEEHERDEMLRLRMAKNT